MNVQAKDVDDPTLRTLEQRLRARLAGLGSVVVAYSGGVDSALVVALAVRALGPRRVLAATAQSPSVPRAELEAAAALAAMLGVEHVIVQTQEFDDPRYRANPSDRCYYCKHELYTRLRQLARERGLAAVVNGTNADDQGDYRPGLAAAAEQGVRSPLAECGVSKQQVRQLAAALGLPVADKPASPCLSSRIPYGEPVTLEKLRRIEAAEAYLRSLGFREVRVRHHERLARIEVPASQIGRLLEPALRAQVDEALRGLGFAYVTVDLRGLRSGSLNEVLLGEGLRAHVEPG